MGGTRSTQSATIDVFRSDREVIAALPASGMGCGQSAAAPEASGPHSPPPLPPSVEQLAVVASPAREKPHSRSQGPGQLRFTKCDDACKGCRELKSCPCKREGLRCVPGEGGCNCRDCGNAGLFLPLPFAPLAKVLKYHCYISVAEGDDEARVVARRVNISLQRTGLLTWFDEHGGPERAKGHGGLVRFLRLLCLFCILGPNID